MNSLQQPVRWVLRQLHFWSTQEPSTRTIINQVHLLSAIQNEKCRNYMGGFGWGVTDDVTLQAIRIQTHTQRGFSIYTTPAMCSCLNLLMQTFIISFLSSYASLFFDANLKWWFSSSKWLVCKKTARFWMRGILLFFGLLFWKLSSLRRKFLHVWRSNGKGRKCWCSHALYNMPLQAMMYAISPAHSLWSEREIYVTQTWQQSYTAMLIFFCEVENMSAEQRKKKCWEK